jgi:hypothetical protein
MTVQRFKDKSKQKEPPAGSQDGEDDAERRLV